MAESCRHCLIREATRRGLCPVCWASPSVRGSHLARFRSRESYVEAGRKSAVKARAGEPTDEDLDAACEAMLAESPLWKPCPYHPADPRYNAVVAEREAAGLPARHPGDQAASLD